MYSSLIPSTQLRQMEIELAVFNPTTKAKYQPKVRQYRSEFDKVKRAFMKVLETSGYQKNRDLLISTQFEDVLNNHNTLVSRTL